MKQEKKIFLSRKKDLLRCSNMVGRLLKNFLKILSSKLKKEKKKFFKFLLLPLPGILKLSERKREIIKSVVYHKGVHKWITCVAQLSLIL